MPVSAGTPIPTDVGAGLAALQDLYLQTERRIQTLIATAALRQNIGSEHFYRMQLLQVQAELTRLHIQAPVVAHAAIRTGYMGAAGAVDHVVGNIPVGGAFAGVDDTAIRQLAAALATPLAQMASTVGRQSADVFRQVGLRQTAVGIAAGLPRKDVSKGVLQDLQHQGVTGFIDKAGRRWKMSTYAAMVARTTTREAVTAGTIDRLGAHGLDLVTVDGDSTDDECEEFVGNTYSLSGDSDEYEQLPDEGTPPIHPNLIAPWMKVSWRGTLGAVWKVRYDGPLIHVTTESGNRLAIGPHHPVMTSTGWLAARHLRKGHQVVRGFLSDPPRARSDEEHFCDVPASIEEVFNALTPSGRQARVPCTRYDFHGDGRFCEGEIDVVVPDSLLRDHHRAALLKHLQKGLLVWADVGAEQFAAAGAAGEFGWMAGGLAGAERDAGFLEPDAHGARGGSSVSGEAFAALTGEVALNVGFDVFDLDGALAAGKTSPGSVICGDACLADLHIALHEFGADARVSRTVQAGKVVDGDAGEILFDEIVTVEHGWFSGHAYDLSVREGYYTANGTAVSNCTHVLVPAEANFDDFMGALLGAT